MTPEPAPRLDPSTEEAHIVMVVNDTIRDTLKKERRLHYLAIAVALLFGLGGGALEVWLHNQFQEQRDSIKDIVSNVSTVYLPDWPDNGKYLTDLVSHVESGDELVIQEDTIGYLSFSDPEEFKKLLASLRKAAVDPKISIRILTLDEDTGEKGRDAQFGPGMEDDFTTKISPEKLKAYVRAHEPYLKQTPFYQIYQKSNHGYSPTKEDYPAFRDALMVVEDAYCSQLLDVNVEVHTTSDASLINGPFLWLKHEASSNKASQWKEMIFAYPRFGGIAKGYAFRTHDNHLMAIFLGQFNMSFNDDKKTQSIAKGSHLHQKLYKRIFGPS